MDYNPYDLVTLRIGGQEIHGRPYQFDSEAENQTTMQNAFGQYVKPTHISTVCPECGQGINVENIQLPEPPFPVIDWVCPNCNPGIDPPVNAFMNPLESDRISEHELDPLLHDPMQQVVDDSNETVADRLGQIGDESESDQVEATPEGVTAEGHTTSALLTDGEDGSARLETEESDEPGESDTAETFFDPVAEETEEVSEPVVEEPVVEEPVVEEPVVEEPVVEEPVVEEPVAEEPVVEEPVAEEPVAEEPVAEEPVVEEPVVEEPVVEEPKKKAAKKTPKKKATKKAPKKKAAKASEKPSSGEGASASPDMPEAQPGAEEAAPLTTETPSKKPLEKAEGLKPEIEDDDMVENE